MKRGRPGDEAASGKELFHYDGKHWPMFSSPALVSNAIYIGSNDGSLRALSLNDGRLLWTFATEGAQHNAAALTKADGTPNYEAAFFGDFYDDTVAGQQKMLTTGAVLSSPVVAGDTVIFGSSDGNVYAVH